MLLRVLALCGKVEEKDRLFVFLKMRGLKPICVQEIPKYVLDKSNYYI